MKPDWNLMRKVLLAVEGSPARNVKIDGYSQDETGYHSHLLVEAGLARGSDVTNMGNLLPQALITSLTLSGHQFAELMRDDVRWQQAMLEAHERGMALTLDAIKRLLATQQLKAAAQGPPRSEGALPDQPKPSVPPADTDSARDVSEMIKDRDNPSTALNDKLRSGTAIVSLRKKDGTIHEGIEAHFTAKAIVVMDVSTIIEPGDMLIRPLSSGLSMGFIVKDPGFQDEMGPSPPCYRITAHRAAPIDSLQASDFWRRLRGEFEQLSKIQSDAPGMHADHKLWLVGLCSRPDSYTGEFAVRMIQGGLNSEFKSKFEDIATQGGIAVGSPHHCNAVEFWLSCLCLDLVQKPRGDVRKEFRQPTDGAVVVPDLLASFAAYCSRLAAMADLRANEKCSRRADEQSQPTDRPEIHPPAAIDLRTPALESDGAALSHNRLPEPEASLVDSAGFQDRVLTESFHGEPKIEMPSPECQPSVSGREIDAPALTGDADKELASQDRERRLLEFRRAHPGTTLADIKYTAQVHTAEFQDWRNDLLKSESVMSDRIEEVLSGSTPILKKPDGRRRK